MKPLLPVLLLSLLTACAPNDKPLKSQVLSPEPAKVEAAAETAPAEARDMSQDDLADKNIRYALLKTNPDLVVERLRPSPYPGLYEVRVKGYGQVYLSADGKYMIQGELFRLDGKNLVNETENAMAEERKALLAAIPESEMIIFPAKGTRKAALYVFTDIDCGYCRKLHAEVVDYNQAGIEVRYLAFPRAGYPSPSAAKLEAVWCSKDRLDAMTRSKQGQAVSSPACANPVKQQYEAGIQMGVRGTPATFTEAGVQVGGYVPAKAMVETLGIR